jgi:hypothetical protein
MLFCRFDRASVIVDDTPALRKALPDQREHAADISLQTGQMPVAQNQCRILPKEPEFKVGKFQVPHRFAIGVVLLVPRTHLIPTTRDPVTS